MVEGIPSFAREILGRRHVAIDVDALCHHLDLLVGQQVAEVIMNHHQVRLGKDGAAFIRNQNPGASPTEIIEKLAEVWRFSGIGDVKARLVGPELELSIIDPCVKVTEGSAKSFMFSYWCGVLSNILGGEFEVGHLAYDSRQDVMKGRIVQHKTQLISSQLKPPQ
jgi:hypothetical protein